MPRTWTINGRFLSQSLSGVQRYAIEIVKQLDQLVAEQHQLAQGLSLEILMPAGRKPELDLQAITIKEAGRRGGHFWEQTELPRNLQGGLLSLCNSGPVVVQKQIVCLHDANTRVYPSSYSLAFRGLYRFLHPALGRRAAMITTVSKHSALELERLGIADPSKIRVMSNGFEHAVRWVPRHSPKTRPLSNGKTIVVIGSPAPHKNIQLLLKIAPELERAGLHLALVGLRDHRVFADQTGSVEMNNVHWLGHLSDEEIAALLQDALCLAFPSFAEGFGIPAVEAMAWQCPVVASDRTSLPEVCGDAALYASPDCPPSWRKQLQALGQNTQLRQELIAKGDVQHKKFSWRSSAKAYLQAMNELDA